MLMSTETALLIAARDEITRLKEQLEAAERLIEALSTLGYNVELAQARKLVGAFPASERLVELTADDDNLDWRVAKWTDPPNQDRGPDA